MSLSHTISPAGERAAVRRRQIATMGVAGLAMGVSLSFIGFGDYNELHRLFTFADLRLLLTFAGAVAVAMVGLRLLVRAPLRRSPFHKRHVIGGVLFGAGWAVSGACPAIALVQLGEGTLGALLTIAGIVVGTRVYDAVNARWLRWDTASCGV